jgi:peptidoglycan hydrolase-like protein with peptidoglycan-binding domain
MSRAPSPAVSEPLAPAVEAGVPAGRWPRRLAVGLALVVVAAAVVLVATNPFGGRPNSGSGVTSGGYATSLARVSERPLSSQTQVSGTLGFSGDATIRVPVGTAPSAVGQAQISLSADRRTLASARSALASDELTLADARARLAADEQRLAVDCAGDNAAQGPASSNLGAGGAGGAGAAGAGCASDMQLVDGDRQARTGDAARVSADRGQVSSAEHALAGARSLLAGLRVHETVYGQSSTYTYLPSAGETVHRGQRLYAIDGQPVLLLYGSTVARRAFVAGMSGGHDVAELNRNLDALGYGHGLAGGSFTAATAAAIAALQRAHGMSVAGALPLGSVVFEPGAVRVTGVAPTAGVGAGVAPGPLLTVSRTARVIAMQLEASEQGEVEVGDPVMITLPDNTTTPGRISYVSGVARSGQSGTTVEVDAVPDDPAATGTLDQAPVNVAITTESVRHALVVPVNALLARPGGGYAVEEVSHGVHHLVAVNTGLFDDADGLVQVSGAGLAAGQHVVVPGE